jgi:hypothetical protein
MTLGFFYCRFFCKTVGKATENQLHTKFPIARRGDWDCKIL